MDKDSSMRSYFVPVGTASGSVPPIIDYVSSWHSARWPVVPGPRGAPVCSRESVRADRSCSERESSVTANTFTCTDHRDHYSDQLSFLHYSVPHTRFRLHRFALPTAN